MSRRRRGDQPMDVATLTQRYATPLPSSVRAAKADRNDDEERTARASALSSRGLRKAGHGWSAVTDPLTVFTANTGQVGGLFPLVGSDALPPWGAPVGVDVDANTAFHLDLVSLILAGFAENPNVFLSGKPGRGKSATVKIICLRSMPFGYRTLVPLDLKNEYSDLVTAAGGVQLEVGPGLAARVNPLDMGPLASRWLQLDADARLELAPQIFGRWVLVLKALAGGAGAQVTPSGVAALTAVLSALTGWEAGAGHLEATTIPAVWAELCNPREQVWKGCRYSSAQDFVEAHRQLTDALGEMVKVALVGMFDAPTNVAIDWDAPIMSMAGRRILETKNDLLIGSAITCMNAWSSTMIAQRPPGQHTIVVRDESWRQLRLGVDAVQALDESLRLSRTEDVVNMLVTHKPGDSAGVGDAGSQAVSIASEMVSLCDTKIMLGQDAGIADQMGQDFELPGMVTDWIKNWAMHGKGRAVWMIGPRVFRVSTILTPLEQQLFDTNQQLRSNDDHHVDDDLVEAAS